MKRKAFTLIELLVVIAIIAILAAILFPVFAQAKQAAKKTNDLMQLKQLGLGNMMYNDSYDDVFITWAYTDNDGLDLGPHWADRLQPFVKSSSIFSDQSNQQKLFQPNGYWLPGAKNKANTEKLKPYRVTYIFNHLIVHSDESAVTPRSASAGAIDAPSSIVLMGPGSNWFSWSRCVLNGQTADLQWNVSKPTDGWDWGYEFWGGVSPTAGYAGGANFNYTDGHAAYSRMTIGNDPSKGKGPNGLYAATFNGAKTRVNVGTGGKCPADYSSGANGY